MKLPTTRISRGFDTGEKRIYEPVLTLLTLDVPNEGTFPKTCHVAFILAEIDSGGLTELVEKAFVKATEQIALRKQQMRVSGVNPLSIDWGEVWATVGPIVYGYIKDLITAGIDDDVFPPQNVSVEISSPDFHWPDGTRLSPEATLEFRGGGARYNLTYYIETRN